jgi:hypothetical protein
MSRHRKYQMLMSILVQVVTIGRIDVALHYVSVTIYGMSRRASGPSPRVFGYLKSGQRRVVVDSRPHLQKEEKMH